MLTLDGIEPNHSIKPSVATKHLEVILKISSRCNIRCDYCYYYQGGDKRWQSRDKKMSFQVVAQLFDFLDKAIDDFHLQSLQIDFHGGEPLLYGKQNFDNLCKAFYKRFASKIKIQLALQTNALLVDEQWAKLFVKHRVAVSVSLDGPETVNDSARKDHQGLGTFARARRGIEHLKATMGVEQLSLLAVIQPGASGKEAYRYLIDVVGIKQLDFLLPSTFNEEVPRTDIEKIANYLLGVWDAWTEDNDPTIKIRLFDAVFARLGGRQSYFFADHTFGQSQAMAITVDSDGKLYGDDSLRANMAWKTFKPMTVFRHSFRQYVAALELWHQKHIRLPSTCKACMWSNLCQGGQLEHRYKDRNGFNNASVYCGALKQLFSTAVGFLYINGLTQTQIKQCITVGGYQ